MADISRSDVATLIQEAYAGDFLNWAAKTSCVLGSFPTRNLGTKVTHEPVMATKPHAKWVQESATASTGVKPTGKVTWVDKTLVAEELAVIVPVHEDVLADATTDVLSDIVKAGGEAIAFALDAAVIFGHNKPTTWTSPALLPSAVNAGGTNHQVYSLTPGTDDLAGKILQAAGGLSDKYDPTVYLTRKGAKFRMANLRDSTGAPIFIPSLSADPTSFDNIYGLNVNYATGTVGDDAGGDVLVWDPNMCEGLVVDGSRVLIGIRQDITVKYLDQATVNSINLAERDMVALRFKARFAYVLGDNIAYGSNVTTSSPVAAIVPSGGS